MIHLITCPSDPLLSSLKQFNIAAQQPQGETISLRPKFWSEDMIYLHPITCTFDCNTWAFGLMAFWKEISANLNSIQIQLLLLNRSAFTCNLLWRWAYENFQSATASTRSRHAKDFFADALVTSGKHVRDRLKSYVNQQYLCIYITMLKELSATNW
jgi:hypothetical protein